MANFIGSARRRSRIIARSAAKPASVKSSRSQRGAGRAASARSTSPMAGKGSFGLPSCGPRRGVRCKDPPFPQAASQPAATAPPAIGVNPGRWQKAQAQPWPQVPGPDQDKELISPRSSPASPAVSRAPTHSNGAVFTVSSECLAEIHPDGALASGRPKIDNCEPAQISFRQALTILAAMKNPL
jgi:hypothetical protein